MKYTMLCAVLFIAYSAFNYLSITNAADNTVIDEMKTQMENIQRMIMQQQEQIKQLQSKLGDKPGSNERLGHSAHIEKDLHHNEEHLLTDGYKDTKKDELDRVVDRRIKGYFDTEEGKEAIASGMPLDMGYDNGFYFKTPDDKFSLKTSGNLQFRYMYEDANRRDDNSSFRIKRGRLKFNGNAFDEHLKYVAQMELHSTGSKDGSKSVEMIDFFGIYGKHHFAKIRFGQWKVPFNSQFMTSHGALQMIDRSEADDVFNLGRQLGVEVFGELMHEKLEYHLGFWNGNFRNERENDNNQHLWIFRTAYRPIGHYIEDESDYEYSDKPALMLASAVSFDNEEDVELELRGFDEFEFDDIDKTQIVGEIGFKYKGVSLVNIIGEKDISIHLEDLTLMIQTL